MIKKTISVKTQGENIEIYLGFDGIRVNIKNLKDKYKLQDNVDIIDYIVNLISKLESQYNRSTVQIFNPEFVISPEHIITAFYNTHKAFNDKKNISNQKKLEFLLYLSTKRQISEAIKYFGIKIDEKELKTPLELTYLIASYENNVETIKESINQSLNIINDPTIITEKSIAKLQKIIDYFKISMNQLEIIFHSNGKKFNEDDAFRNNNLNDLYEACLEIIYEKMAFLSLEKTPKPE